MPGRLSSLLTVLACLTPGAALAWSEAALDRVRQAQTSAVDIPGQALALGHLIWTDDQRDPEAAALAREKLIGYGETAFEAMFAMTDLAPDRFKTDVIAAMLEARRANPAAAATHFAPGLDRAIWFGSRGARRLAIPYAARTRFLGGMLPSIDAAYEDPMLRGIVIRSLPRYQHAGARFFLLDVLIDGSPEEKKLAADALVRIGGRAIESLRDATLSEVQLVRETAIAALLPSTAVNDLTTLHEYIYVHPDDDPELLKLIRERAAMLEKLLEQEQEYGDSDF